jgi:hypothetical protein
MKPQIAIIDGGRFLSRHDGAIVYYDSRHQILKARWEVDTPSSWSTHAWRTLPIETSYSVPGARRGKRP